MFTKMYAIVKSLYITPELTLYFSLFNTHTKNLTKILNILSSVCSTYYYFLVFPNASESCAFCITMDPRKEFPLLLKLFHSWLAIILLFRWKYWLSTKWAAVSGHILTLNDKKTTTISTDTTHKGQKPSCSIQAGARPKNAGTRVRKAEFFGIGGASIMWMI